MMMNIVRFASTSKLLHTTRGRGAHSSGAGGQVPEQPQQQREEDGHPHLGGAWAGNTRL